MAGTKHKETNDDYEPNLCCGVLDCFNFGIERRVMLCHCDT